MLVKERVVIDETHKQYKPQPELQVAPPPVKKKVRKAKPNHLLRKVMATFVMLALSSTFVTMQSSHVDMAGYALDKDKSALTKLQKENEQLHLELARLKSPERIQEIAKKELKMSVPKTVYYATSRSVAAPTPQMPMQKQTPTENIVTMVENLIKQIIS